MNTENLTENSEDQDILENTEKTKENQDEEVLGLFDLNFNLFHLKIQRQRFLFSKDKKFQSHLISRMKKKIATSHLFETALDRYQENLLRFKREYYF